MRRVMGALGLTVVALALGVLSFTPAVALPSEPAGPCLPAGLCLPDPPTDPCTVVPCPPCADPACLVEAPELPPEVPAIPADPLSAPVPGGIPSALTDVLTSPPTDSAAAPPSPVPAAAPEAPAPGEAGTRGDARSEPVRAGGRADTGPESIRTSSARRAVAAVAQTARSFAALLVLAGLVGGFVIIQGRIDRRDPKLSAAPLTRDDELLRFG